LEASCERSGGGCVASSPQARRLSVAIAPRTKTSSPGLVPPAAEEKNWSRPHVSGRVNPDRPYLGRSRFLSKPCVRSFSAQWFSTEHSTGILATPLRVFHLHPSASTAGRFWLPFANEVRALMHLDLTQPDTSCLLLFVKAAGSGRETRAEHRTARYRPPVTVRKAFSGLWKTPRSPPGRFLRGPRAGIRGS